VVGGGDEFVGGRLLEGDDLGPDALVAQVRAEPREVAVTGTQHHGVDVVGQGDGVQAHTDVPVGLLGAVAEGLDVLDAGLEADVDERLEEGLLLGGVGADDVGDSAGQLPVVDRRVEESSVVDVPRVEALSAVIEVLRVGQHGHALSRMDVLHVDPWPTRGHISLAPGSGRARRRSPGPSEAETFDCRPANTQVWPLSQSTAPPGGWAEP
jgi:hypothetical protein